MTWHASLSVDYSLQDGRSVARHVHQGPLRVLQSLYPEGPSICHNILVHPPGGLVGGDTLDMRFTVDPGAHGLITTPGATRFYRSTGEQALQRTGIKMHPGSRLEWLPMEALLYDGCLAENHLSMDLAPGAELMGWDVLALGLPHANLPFGHGRFCQHIELPGAWLERGVIHAQDHRLLNSPLGMAGRQCMASLFMVTGSVLERHRRDQLLDATRDHLRAHSLAPWGGVTSPNPQVIILRVLATQVEPAMGLLKSVWTCWRHLAWGLSADPPRIWTM